MKLLSTYPEQNQSKLYVLLNGSCMVEVLSTDINITFFSAAEEEDTQRKMQKLLLCKSCVWLHFVTFKASYTVI